MFQINVGLYEQICCVVRPIYLITGIRLARKLVNTEAIQRLAARIVERPSNLCSHHEYDSDAYLECYVRHGSLTVYHPAGTCRMGRADDKTTVVDPQLRSVRRV